MAEHDIKIIKEDGSGIPTEFNVLAEANKMLGFDDSVNPKMIDMDLELARIKGIDLSPSALLYMFNHNTSLGSDCETTWTAYNAGTVVDDAVNFKVGTYGQKITADADTKGAYISETLDWTAFGDGAVSVTDDYVELALYLSTQDLADLVGASIRIEFYDGANAWYYEITQGSLGENWNYLKIQKSAFIGTADWSAITTIRCYISGTPTAEVIFTIDAIRMTREDPIDANPNPLQIENDGVIERVFEVTSGTLFLGYDGSDFVLKALETSAMFSTLTFAADIYIQANCIANAEAGVLVGLYQDATNRYFSYVIEDELRIYRQIAGGAATKTYSYPVDLGDELSFSVRIQGESDYAHVSKSGSNLAGIGIKKASLSDTQNAMLTLFEDVCLTSFVASSSPLMIK